MCKCVFECVCCVLCVCAVDRKSLSLFTITCVCECVCMGCVAGGENVCVCAVDRAAVKRKSPSLCMMLGDKKRSCLADQGSRTLDGCVSERKCVSVCVYVSVCAPICIHLFLHNAPIQVHAHFGVDLLRVDQRHHGSLRTTADGAVFVYVWGQEWAGKKNEGGRKKGCACVCACF